MGLWIVVLLPILAAIVWVIWLTFRDDITLKRVERSERALTKEVPALPPSTDWIGPIPKSEEKIEYPCGHVASTIFEMNVWGEPIALVDASEKMPPKCGDCFFAEMRPFLIRCALCGYAIGPGDPVILYSGGAFRADSTFVGEGEKRRALGCLKWDCCECGAGFAGYWTREGFKPEFDNGRTAAEEALATDKPVIRNV